MTLLNPDGTPYQLGALRAYNPSSPEYELFNEWDAESIRQGGSPIYYHELTFASSQVDPVYQEVRSKLWNPHPVELWCYYEPIPSQNALGVAGIDSMDEMVFECNWKDVLDRLGRYGMGLPKPGSRIRSPHLNEDWELVQAALGEFRGWQAIRVQLICKRFQESLTTGEGRVTQGATPYRIDDQLYDG